MIPGNHGAGVGALKALRRHADQPQEALPNWACSALARPRRIQVLQGFLAFIHAASTGVFTHAHCVSSLCTIYKAFWCVVAAEQRDDGASALMSFLLRAGEVLKGRRGSYTITKQVSPTLWFAK